MRILFYRDPSLKPSRSSIDESIVNCDRLTVPGLSLLAAGPPPSRFPPPCAGAGLSAGRALMRRVKALTPIPFPCRGEAIASPGTLLAGLVSLLDPIDGARGAGRDTVWAGRACVDGRSTVAGAGFLSGVGRVTVGAGLACVDGRSTVAGAGFLSGVGRVTVGAGLACVDGRSTVAGAGFFSGAGV